MDTTLHGAGLGYRRDLAENFLDLPANSPIDFIEAAPENWIRMGGAARKRFDAAAERLPLALHGLSLSLGGQAPLDMELLAGIKAMMRQYRCGFFSDHLSYCQDLGGHLYDLLPLPFTAESVRHTAERIRRVQDFLGCRISIDRRLTRGETAEYAMNQIRRLPAVEAAGAEVRMYKYERPSWTGLLYPTDCYFPTWVIEEDHPVCETLMEAYSGLFGKKARLDKWTFSTNGVAIMGMHGIPCIGFGPGHENQAHAPNEVTWKEEIVACAALYAAIPSLYARKYAARMPEHTENIVER